MKRIRLTKKRLAMLDAALTMDDILHERFRRLNEEVKQEWYKLHRARQVVRVERRVSDKVLVACTILDVQVTPDGTRVIVA